MAFLETHGIVKTFPGVVALKNIDIAVDLGEIHILAGENGAGKSTLVKVLVGAYRPTAGTLSIEGRDPLADPALFDLVAYVPQELSLFPNMTLAENLFMPFGKAGLTSPVLDRRELNRRAEAFIDRFRIHGRPNQKVASLPVADQQVLQIARAFSNTKAKVLILDEPTSSLTARETARIFDVVRELRATDHGVIFISHKMSEIYELGDRVTVLRNGESVGTRPMAAVSEGELIRMMSGTEIRTDQSFRPDAEPGETVLSVSGLTGARFSDVSFELRRGEILGFAGLVGSGRTEVMQTVFGYLEAQAGSVALEGRPLKLGSTRRSVDAGILYLSEERRLHGILPALSVHENVGVSLFRETAPAGVISAQAEARRVAGVVADYQVKTSSTRKKISLLSGGNQQKIIIGRAMAQRPKLIIFDEPTKGIDIKTKVEIYALMKRLAEEGVGIIVVSSEMDELLRCASRIVTMYHGAVVGDFDARNTDNTSLVTSILGAGNMGQL